ncbi:MAG: hypothetical protein J6D16_02485 [Clostridia bacterium]|nr:hypothetical protein [Clostridia bacterium]
MKLEFFTPSYGVPADSFGAATFGFVGAENERAAASIALPNDLWGDMLAGSYEECLAKLDRLPKKAWQVGIVLFGNAGGENAFLRELQSRLEIPFVGGGAAICPETGKGALLTGGGQAAILLVCDERYGFEVLRENIHHEILGEHEVVFSDPRRIDSIDGNDPRVWLAEQKAKLGFSPDDFEHLTLSDLRGNNAHLSLVDGEIRSGRDLERRMLLRYVPRDKVQERMQAFYGDADTVIFGCAGLRGILPEKLHTRGVGLFLFGEVCYADGQSEFANLMLSGLRIKSRL